MTLNALGIDTATTASVNNYGLFNNEENPRTIIMTVERHRCVYQRVIASLSLLRAFVRHVKITPNYKIIANYHQHN